MLAGTAAIDWARATLSRASEHLTAAQRPDVVNPVLAEVRTISNLVGPRDRAAWRIPDALAALADVGRALGRLNW